MKNVPTVDQPLAVLHMGEARAVFEALRSALVDRRVENESAGPLGATEITSWRIRPDLLLEFHLANGGCSLFIRTPPTPSGDAEALARLEAIVLTSQLTENADGFEIHGIFSSFEAAVRHISKDADLGVCAERALLARWREPATMHEYVGPGLDGQSTHWCASKQPFREQAAAHIRASDARAAALRGAWQKVSDELDHIPGGMHADLEDAASALWSFFDGSGPDLNKRIIRLVKDANEEAERAEEAEARATTLERELEEARAVMEPFAKAGQVFIDTVFSDQAPIRIPNIDITVADLRAAARLSNQKGQSR